MRVTKHLRILGRVQAVGFRFFMEREARVRGITGWVRNRRDGSVEAIVQGSPEAVEEMIACARRGPRSALVTEVTVSEHDGNYTEFTIRPTE